MTDYLARWIYPLFLERENVLCPSQGALGQQGVIRSYLGPGNALVLLCGTWKILNDWNYHSDHWYMLGIPRKLWDVDCLQDVLIMSI